MPVVSTLLTQAAFLVLRALHRKRAASAAGSNEQSLRSARAIVVFLAFVATLPFLGTIREGIGIVGVIIMLAMYVLTGKYVPA